jgi:diketogulonate reductase-like aldo/keto reductase
VRVHSFGWLGDPVSVIGQGTWHLERCEPARAIAALRSGLDAGMTHIDTAEMYGSGRVEEIVGEAITDRRDEVFLVSKVLPSHATFEGVLGACEESLRRLRTDRLDLYLLHWPGRFPLERTIAAFEQLVRDGKIRAYGVSNFNVDEMERAVAITGAKRIACNQVFYHLDDRTIEHAVIPWCERRGVAVVGYSPFGSGHFPGPRSAGGRLLADVARQRGATPRQVALAFLTRRRALFTIPMASSVAHALENAAAGKLRLAPADICLIDAAFPLPRPRPDLPML